MLGKRMHGNAKTGVFGRSSSKGKDILSKPGSSKYNKSQIETGDTDVNVTFPYIRLTDTADQLPCYASILTRSSEEGIGINDLDQLQKELEKLLSVSAVRSRLLNSELEFLDKPPPPKHRKVEEKVKPTKSAKPTYKLVPECEAPPEVVVVPKNDTETKFWLAADAYCSAVTGDDNAFLEDLIEEMNQDTDLKLNEVGTHYVDEWTIESRQKYNVDIIKNNVNSIPSNGFVPNKSGEPFSESVMLPLASALLEENMNKLTPQDKLKELGMKSVNNGVCLDKRLRNELAELGILDLDDIQKANGKARFQDDEIAQEIQLCHEELTKLNSNNIKELNRLRHAVNKDIRRQEYIKKLDEVDKKIEEIYNKLLSATPKERPSLEWEAVRIIEMQKKLHKETVDMFNSVP